MVSGCNRILNTSEELKKYIHKNYDTECGSGFYSINDIDIASSYAYRSAARFGGHPYLNYFELNINKIIENKITISYFNRLNEETLEYLSLNINGKLHDNCPLKRYRNLRPVDVCMDCKNKDCKWSANYIESILLDCSFFNLTDIFIDYYDNKINKNEASEKIYEMLDEETGGNFKFQIVLRGEILDIDNNDYLNFIKSIKLG